jgi:lysophospholipase L1-like esterase
MAMKPPVKTPLFAALVLIAGGSVIALLIAEAALRIHNPFGFRMRGNTLVLPVNETYIIEDRSIRGLEGLDTRIEHRKNALGFRGEAYPQDFAARLTIIAVGGSTTESFYISDGKTWPDLLAKGLKSRFPGLWLNNAGLDGHSTWGHLALIREYIIDLHPDVVLLLVGVNDLFADGPNQYDRAAAGGLLNLLADYSETVSTAVNLYRARQTAKMTALGTIPKPNDLRQFPQLTIDQAQIQALLAQAQPGLAAYRRRLTDILELLQKAGTAPVLITQPSLLGPVVDPYGDVDLGNIEVNLWGRRLNGLAVWSLLEAYNDVTRSVARERDAGLVDLAAAMPKSRRYYYDFFHFNNEGSAEVADIVGRALWPWLAARFAAEAAAPCG